MIGKGVLTECSAPFFALNRSAVYADKKRKRTGEKEERRREQDEYYNNRFAWKLHEKF